MKILSKLFRPAPTWNANAINDLADYIEDLPGTAHLGNIVWHSAACLWPALIMPMSGLLDRGRLAAKLGVSQVELYKMVHPISEKAVPEGVTMEHLTRAVVVEMLRNLAKTGKVVWNVPFENAVRQV